MKSTSYNPYPGVYLRYCHLSSFNNWTSEVPDEVSVMFQQHMEYTIGVATWIERLVISV